MLLRSAAMNGRPFSHAQITAACLESVKISRSQVSVGVDTNSRAKRAQTLSLPISDSGSDYGDLSCRHSESSFWLVGKSNTTDGRDALRSTRNATIPKTRHRDHDLAHRILGIVTMTKMKTVVG